MGALVAAWIPCNAQFQPHLRSIVWFLWPIPILLNFAMEHGEDWTTWVAYIAIVAILAAAVSGWVAIRGDR